MICDRFLEKKRDGFINDGKSIPPDAITHLAITLHNLPEGMAVGAVFAEILRTQQVLPSAMSAGFALSIGIAVQNFPEGAIVSLPLCARGKSKTRSFLWGVLSGVVEPLGAALTVLAAGIAVPLLPYLLGFAAGAMLYAVLDGFTDSNDTHSRSALTSLSFSVGFCVMMSLDVILG